MKSNPILVHSSFDPRRGGHAPGDLRDAFRDALDAYESWEDGKPEPKIEVRGQEVPISRVAGLLWNCTDILPSMLCTQLADLRRGFDDRGFGSYAHGARFLRELIARASP